MRKKPRSFRRQLSMAFILLAIGSTTVLAGLILTTAVKSITTHYEGMAIDSTRLAARLLSRFPGTAPGGGPKTPALTRKAVAETLADELMAEHVVVLDPYGRILAFRGPASIEIAEVMPDALATLLGPPGTAKAGKDRILRTRNGIWVGIALSPSGPLPGGWVVTHHTLREGKRLVWYTVLYVVSLVTVLIAIAFPLGLRFSRLFTRPIDALVEGAQRFGRGDLNHKVEGGDYIEFVRVARAFNEMAASLKSYMAKVEQEAQLREKIESEMRIASFLQQSLLPARLPESPRFELSARSQPAEEVGGDFYDVLRLSDGRIMIAIGDATNKGLPAALHVTECASAFRAYATQQDSPGRVLGYLNNFLQERLGDTCRFVTMFLMVYDEITGRVVYSLAGHNPPFLVQCEGRETVFLTEGRGLPLGLLPETEYGEGEVQLEKNDMLLLYTDGITEATDGNGRLLGTDGVLRVLLDRCGNPADDIVRGITELALEHCGTAPQSDDISLVCLRRIL